MANQQSSDRGTTMFSSPPSFGPNQYNFYSPNRSPSSSSSTTTSTTSQLHHQPLSPSIYPSSSFMSPPPPSHHQHHHITSPSSSSSFQPTSPQPSPDSTRYRTPQPVPLISSQNQTLAKEIISIFSWFFFFLLFLGYGNLPIFTRYMTTHLGTTLAICGRLILNLFSIFCLYGTFSAYFYYRKTPPTPIQDGEGQNHGIQQLSSQTTWRRIRPQSPTTTTTLVPAPPPIQARRRLEMSPPNKSPSSVKPDFPVNDFVSLEKYLALCDEEEDRKQSTLRMKQQRLFPGDDRQNIFNLEYRPAIRRAPENLQQGTHDRFSSRNTAFANERLELLGISRNQKERWIERLKFWFSRQILQPLLWAIDHPDSPLESIPGISSTFSNSNYSQPAMINDIRSRVLSMYLSVGDCPCDYIEKRIRRLAQGQVLSSYQWEDARPSSQLGLSSRFTSQGIPDAQILIHLFCKYIDLSSSDLGEKSRFQSRFFVRVPDHPLHHKDLDICIFQQSLLPPHFEVVVSKGKKLDYWFVAHGSQNVFMAMVLFLFYFNDSTKGSVSVFGWKSRRLLDEIFKD